MINQIRSTEDVVEATFSALAFEVGGGFKKLF